MAEEEEKKKFNFKKIALFGIGPIALVGIGVGVGAFLFMPTQTPVEQVEELIEKKLLNEANFYITENLSLLAKGEIKKLIGLLSQKGYTLIATKVFEKNGFIKIELALAKGKKDYDKRKKILNKEHAKEIKNY